MMKLKKSLYVKADENITMAQARYKKDYDKKLHKKKVCTCVIKSITLYTSV